MREREREREKERELLIESAPLSLFTLKRERERDILHCLKSSLKHILSLY